MTDKNTEKYRVMAEKPVGALLTSYAIPAIVAMAASSVYNIIDGIFVGQGVGAEAIMGLALTSPLMSLTSAFGAMVGVGAATLMSVKLGRKDYDCARRILGNVVLMNVVFGLLLALLIGCYLDPILRLFGASAATLPYASDFMTIILAGNVVTHLYLGLNAMLRATNRPRQAMWATFGTVVLNCLLAPIFIFLFGWGIRGAALATVLSQAIMLCWQLRLFADKREFIRLERQLIRPDLRLIGDSLLVGLPQFLINLCACFVAALMTHSLTTYGGDVAVGAFGICNRLVLFIVMVVIGLNQGMQPIAGYNFGAGHYDRVLKVVRLALVVATVITTTGFIIGTFFSTPFVTLFAKDAPALIQLSAHALKWMVALFPVVGIQIVATAFFQSIGYAGRSIFLSLTRQLLFLVPALLLLPHVTSDPLEGLWMASPLSDGIATLLAVVMLIKEMRRLGAKQQAE